MNFDSFTPHGFCLAWQPGLIWLQAVSDLLIAIAYFSIPAALITFLRRRRDLAFKPIFALFAAFIMACGTTHIMGVLTLWVPAYWLDGGIKALTAAVSLITAVVLWRQMPQALALPSPEQLRAANAALAAGIAERDRATSELRASQERLRRFYDRTPAALHATDNEARLVGVSDRWLQLLGTTREAALGRPITDFYMPEDHEPVRAALAALNAGLPPPVRAERRLRRADGSARDAEAVFAAEHDAEGRLQTVFVALTDITARREAEAALALTEANLRQAQKMEAVGQLTGGIAHDFNNLLQAVLGSLELLERDPILDNRSRRRVELAIAAAQRGARLVSQLLAFSRKQNLAPQRLEPADIVRGIEDLLARTCGDRCRLSIGPSTGIWPVVADRNQLETALLNLAINARDATVDTAALIEIGFANRVLSEAEAQTLDTEMHGGKFVAVTVRDNGAGMDEATRSRALEPFFTTKPPGAGTGLGLPQCYGFARQSGGTLLLESVLGQGTTVTILLPRAGEGAMRRILPTTDILGHGETILLADDDPLLRTTVTETLVDNGYQVIPTESGAAALEALAQAPQIALLFTDIVMPGMDGVALARAVRARRPDLPILFSSGFTDTPVLENWPEPVDLLAKPYAAEELLTRLRAAITTARPNAAA